MLLEKKKESEFMIFKGSMISINVYGMNNSFFSPEIE